MTDLYHMYMYLNEHFQYFFTKKKKFIPLTPKKCIFGMTDGILIPFRPVSGDLEART